MPRPTKNQKRIKQAKALLNNDTLSEIFEARREDIRDRWQSSDTTQAREACYYEIKALEGLRDAIYAIGTDTSG